MMHRPHCSTYGSFWSCGCTKSARPCAAMLMLDVFAWLMPMAVSRKCG